MKQLFLKYIFAQLKKLIMTKIYSILLLIPVLFFSQYQKVELDKSFATNGIYTDNTLENNELAISKILPDGKILFFRSDNNPASNGETLTKFLPNGTVDLTFGNNGSIYTKDILQLSTSSPSPNASILFSSDGSIYISSFKFETFSSQIVKLNQNGTINNNFGNNGILTLNNTSILIYTGRNQIELSNGNLLFELGSVNGDGFKLLCITKNGSIVNSFGNNGMLIFSDIINSLYSINNQFYAVTDKYISNNNSTQFVLKRFNNDSTIDNSFQTISETFVDSNLYFPYVDKANNLYTVKLSNLTDNINNTASVIKKYSLNGTPINTFGNNGSVSNPNYLTQLTFNTDNDLLFSGAKYYGNGLFNPIIIKYTKNGILDTNFNQTGYYEELNSSLGYSLNLNYNTLTNNEILVSGVTDNLQVKYLAKYKLTEVLSTKDIENSKIQIYPNPANEFISIDNLSNNTEFEIYDIQGKLVNKEKYKNSQISLKNLSKGIYILKIPTENYSQKLIVE